MFNYRKSSIVSKRSQAREDIIANIYGSVSSVEDVEGYIFNCLLVGGGAEYYGMTESEYSALVHECANQVIKDNS